MADEVDKNPPGDAGEGDQGTLKDGGHAEESPIAHPSTPDLSRDTSSDGLAWKIGDAMKSLQTGRAKIMADHFEEIARATSQAMRPFQTGEQPGAQLREIFKNCQVRLPSVSDLSAAQPHETTDSGSKESEGISALDKKYNSLLRDFTSLSDKLDAKFKERSDELDAKFKERSDQSDAEFGKLTETYRTTETRVEDVGKRVATAEKQLAGTEHRSIEIVGLMSSIVALVLVSATTANSQPNAFAAYLIILVTAAGLMVFSCLLHAFFQPDARRSFTTYWLPFAVAPIVFILGAGLLLFCQSLKH